MTTNLSMIIDHLEPYMGDYASDFVAMELLILNRHYVAVDYDPIRMQSSVHYRTADIPHEILRELLANLRKPLEIIIGPSETTKLLNKLSQELDGRTSGIKQKHPRVLYQAT